MASINKIDKNKYQIVVSYTGKDGKRKFKKKQFTGTLKEARQEAILFEEEIKNTDFIDGHLIKFKDFAEKWLAEVALINVSPSTFEGYERFLREFIYPVIGNKYLSDIKPPHLQGLINDYNKQGLHSKTIKRRFCSINGVFKYAYQLCYIDDNPCTRLVYPKTQKDSQLHYFDIEQSKVFLKLVEQENIQYQIYFNLALFGGFRRGEIVALTWNDIDVKNRQILINKAIHRCKQGEIVRQPKTQGSIRNVTVPDICFNLLEKWHKTNKNKFVFIQSDGSRMCLDTPSHKFKKIIENYNKTAEEPLPMIHLHDLRHSNATILLASNISIETVSARLGHAQCSTTLDIYGHSMKSVDIQASDKIYNILS